MICVIQLDGLGAEPLERLLDAGDLPVLGEFLRAHPRRELTTPADRFPASVYPTLYSGKGADEHGLFYPFQWDPSLQRIVTADRLLHPETIWQRVGREGGRSLVIDPYEQPPHEVPLGRLISGWQLSERVVLRRWSRPRSMWPSLAGKGVPPRATETFGPRREPELRALAEGLLDAGPRVAELVERELGAGSFDLAWICFIAPHVAGHRLWGSPELDEIYRSTDRALGRVLDALPAGTDPILICPLGMEADRARADLLPEMLGRVLGEAPAPAGDPAQADPGAGSVDAADQTDSGAMWRLRAAMPAGLRSGIARSIPAPVARALTARLELRGVDWSRTRAFAHPSDNQGYVRFNLRYRERDGIVDPTGADALADEVRDGLLSFTGPDGEPAVEAVERVPVTGSEVGLPDLVVRWAPAGAGGTGMVRSERFGEVRRHGAGSGRTGNHPSDGAWLAGALLGLDGSGPVPLSSLAERIVGAAGGA